MIIRKSMEKYIFLFFQESKGRWQFLNQKIYKFRQANFAIDQSRSKGKENFTLIQFITGGISLLVLCPSKRGPPPFATPFFRPLVFSSPVSVLRDCAIKLDSKGVKEFTKEFSQA